MAAPEIMISSSITTPNLSRSSTSTESTTGTNPSLFSSYSSSIITPASDTGPSFVRVHDGSKHALGTSKIRSMDIGCHLDKVQPDMGCIEVDVIKGSPKIGTSIATAVRRAKTFAKRINVGRVISRSKRRSSMSEGDGTAAGDTQSEEDPHSIITEEKRIASAGNFPSLDSEQEVLYSLGSAPKLTQSAKSAYPSSLTNKASISSLSLLAVHGSPNPSCYDNVQPFALSSGRTPPHIYAARVAFFIPWCVIVGGMILLAPTHLPGVLTITPGPSSSHAITPALPPFGPRRFAYWAECAYYHVLIFLGCTTCALWFCSGNLAVGTCASAGMLARWAFVWRSGWGRLVQSKRIQLGEDDAESVWLALTEKYLGRKIGGGSEDGVEIYVGDVLMPTDISEMKVGGDDDEDDGEVSE